MGTYNSHLSKNAMYEITTTFPHNETGEAWFLGENT